MRNIRIAKIYLLQSLLLLPFLFVISTTFIITNDLANGIVSGKYFWFYMSMGGVALSVLLTSFFAKKPLQFNYSDLFILLFGVSIFFTSLIINRDVSANELKLTLLTLLIVLYLSIRVIVNSFRSIKFSQNLFCFFIILTGFIEAVWGLLQLYGFDSSQHSLFKTTGSFFNPGPYAGYLAMVFPLSLYYWLNPFKDINYKITRWKYYLFIGLKWFAGITCIAMILILPAAMSRASWLAVGGGSIVVIYFYLKEYYPIKEYYELHKKKIRWISVLAIILLIIGFSGMYLMKKDSADGRTLMWKISLQTITKHPFGVGLGNFSGAYGDTQAEYFLSGKASDTEEYVAGNPEYAFNEYFQILVETGIVGFILFVLLIISIIYCLYKTKKWGILGSLLSLLIFSFFSYPFSVLPYLIVLTFLLALTFSNEQGRKSKSLLLIILMNVCLFIITGYCMVRQYPVYKAYKQWNTERIYYNIGLYKDVADSYGKLYPYLQNDIKFLFEYAQSLSKSQQYTQSNEVLRRAMQISCDPMLYNIKGKNHQAMKEYGLAEYNLIKSTQIVPNRIYPYYLLVKLYDEMGLRNKASEMATIVFTKEPKVMSTAVREMREELNHFKDNN